MTKEELFEKALDRVCIRLAHELYYHEDEEDEDCKGVNIAASQYRYDAKLLKQKYLNEALDNRYYTPKLFVEVKECSDSK